MLSAGLVAVGHLRKPVKFDRIWAGRYTTFARNAVDGTIWGCGLNNFKQLGSVDPPHMQDHCVFSMVQLPAFDPKIRFVDLNYIFLQFSRVPVFVDFRYISSSTEHFLQD